MDHPQQAHIHHQAAGKYRHRPLIAFKMHAHAPALERLRARREARSKRQSAQLNNSDH